MLEAGQTYIDIHGNDEVYKLSYFDEAGDPCLTPISKEAKYITADTQHFFYHDFQQNFITLESSMSESQGKRIDAEHPIVQAILATSAFLFFLAIVFFSLQHGCDQVDRKKKLERQRIESNFKILDDPPKEY